MLKSVKEASKAFRPPLLLPFLTQIFRMFDPREDLIDYEIRTAIQNSTDPRSALFVPEVPFEFLIRRQIAHLLNPSVQSARFIYDGQGSIKPIRLIHLVVGTQVFRCIKGVYLRTRVSTSCV